MVVALTDLPLYFPLVQIVGRVVAQIAQICKPGLEDFSILRRFFGLKECESEASHRR